MSTLSAFGLWWSGLAGGRQAGVLWPAVRRRVGDGLPPRSRWRRDASLAARRALQRQFCLRRGRAWGMDILPGAAGAGAGTRALRRAVCCGWACAAEWWRASRREGHVRIGVAHRPEMPGGAGGAGDEGGWAAAAAAAAGGPGRALPPVRPQPPWLKVEKGPPPSSGALLSLLRFVRAPPGEVPEVRLGARTGSRVGPRGLVEASRGRGSQETRKL